MLPDLKGEAQPQRKHIDTTIVAVQSGIRQVLVAKNGVQAILKAVAYTKGGKEIEIGAIAFNPPFVRQSMGVCFKIHAPVTVSFKIKAKPETKTSAPYRIVPFAFLLIEKQGKKAKSQRKMGTEGLLELQSRLKQKVATSVCTAQFKPRTA